MTAISSGMAVRAAEMSLIVALPFSPNKFSSDVSAGEKQTYVPIWTMNSMHAINWLLWFPWTTFRHPHGTLRVPATCRLGRPSVRTHRFGVSEPQEKRDAARDARGHRAGQASEKPVAHAHTRPLIEASRRVQHLSKRLALFNGPPSTQGLETSWEVARQKFCSFSHSHIRSRAWSNLFTIANKSLTASPAPSHGVRRVEHVADLLERELVRVLREVQAVPRGCECRRRCLRLLLRNLEGLGCLGELPRERGPVRIACVSVLKVAPSSSRRRLGTWPVGLVALVT